MDDRPKWSFLQLAALFVTILLCAFLVTAATYVSGGFSVIGTTYEEGHITLETARASAEEQLGDAERKLLDGEKELTSGREELESGRLELQAAEKTLREGEAKLQQAEIDLAEGWATLQEGEQELYAGKLELASGQATYNKEKSGADTALAAGWAKLQQGEADLSAGKQAAAQLRAGITDANGAAASLTKSRGGGSFADAASIILATLTSTPAYAGLDGVYGSEFNGCNDWAAHVARANQILGTTTILSTSQEFDREAVVSTRFAELQPQLDVAVQAQVEQAVAGFVPSQPVVSSDDVTDTDVSTLTVGDEAPVLAIDAAAAAAEKEAYKNLIQPEIQAAVYAEALAQIESEVVTPLAPTVPTPEQQLAQVVLGIAQNVEGQYDGVLDQTAPLSQLVAGISAMDPGLAQLIGPLGAALEMPQTDLDDKRAKIDALATALNAPHTAQAFGAAEQAADGQVAKGTQDLSNGYAEYYGQKAYAEQALGAARSQLSAGHIKLLGGEADLYEGYATYYEGLGEYNAGKAELEDGHKQYLEGKKTLEEGTATYEAGLKEWTAGKEEYEAAKLDAEKQLAEGEQTLASAGSLLTGLGATIETGVSEGTPFAKVHHGFGAIPWIGLLVMAFIVTLVAMAVSSRIRKKNSAATALMSQSGLSNPAIAVRLYWPLITVAVFAAALGICIGLPLVASVLESMSGGVVTMDSANVPLIILIGVVAVLATLLGAAIAASKLPSEGGRVLEPQPTM